jgi:hypothetical protein
VYEAHAAGVQYEVIMAEWVLVLSFIFYGPARRKVPRFYGPDGLVFLWGSTDSVDTLYSGAAEMDMIRPFTEAHIFLFRGRIVRGVVDIGCHYDLEALVGSLLS